MIDKNEPAYPVIEEESFRGNICVGLTIRAELAARAMHGMLAGDVHCTTNPSNIAKYAVKYADALIAELNKGE